MLTKKLTVSIYYLLLDPTFVYFHSGDGMNMFNSKFIGGKLKASVCTLFEPLSYGEKGRRILFC